MKTTTFTFRSVFIPTEQEAQAGKVPYALFAMPRKEVPSHIKEELEAANIPNLPSVNFQTPLTGPAVIAYKGVERGILGGKRYSIEVDYYDENVRVTGSNSKYISIEPEAIKLNTIAEVASPFVGVESNEEADKLAVALNQAVRRAATERFKLIAQRNAASSNPDAVTPSGTPDTSDSPF